MQSHSNVVANSHRRVTSNANSSNARELMKPLSLSEAIAEGCSPPPLSVSDKVVWISDNGPEFGVVRWLGKLPDVGQEWMAGVDFVNAVGSGTGLYNDEQLFETKMNHASLVPVIGLMKANDYLGTAYPSAGQVINSNANANDNYLPQKPRRTKLSKSRDESKSDDSKRSSSTNKSMTTDGIESYNVSVREISMTAHNTNINSNNVVSNHSSNTTNSSNNNEISNSNALKAKPNELSAAADLSASLTANPVLKNAPSITTTSSHSNEKCKLTNTNSYVNNRIEVNGIASEYDLEIGSVVEVIIDSIPRYGVVRWIGALPEHNKTDESSCAMAGIEMEDESSDFTDGTYQGKRVFECAPRKAYFAKLGECTKDSRFISLSDRRRSALFGSIDCPTVTGDVPPLSTADDLQALCGKNRGIQGHHNSCYLDATLFSMFSCTTIFESLLHRPPRTDDIPEYCEVQRVLKEEIVNPLRENLYVRADRVMHLRTLLEKISSVRGLTSEEKDPEELLNLLLNEILKAEPFLKLSSGLESFFYQLFVEKDEKLQLPTVQQLFDQSFLASDIKLREVPPCLLIQMPRFGRQFKMYPRIIPSLYLDITDVLENSPRQCAICGLVADYECKECFGQFGEGLDSIAFCAKCLEKIHGHKKRSKHKTTKLSIPPEFNMLKEHTQIPRIYMELFAVLCIETSHYVSFVKCGSGPDSPWCFFDSMADRKGEQNGYNIPEVVSFPDLRWWLSEEGTSFLLSTKDDKMLPEMPRRLLCDAYICWYASDVLRYR